MTQLHQVLATERNVKKVTQQRITDGYQLLQKPALLTGIVRSYRPLADDAEQLPTEKTHVQVKTTEVLTDVRNQLERLWDVIATKDWANTEAKADVIVDGTTLLTQAPATYLLWLETQLTDVRTILSSLPRLDPADEWEWSEDQDCYATPPHETRSTKKVPRVLVKAEATDKHPAQVDVWQEDVIVGFWATVKFSGALPAQQIRELTDRVNKLKEAVEVARAEANSHEVTDKVIARPALDYIFGGIDAH